MKNNQTKLHILKSSGRKITLFIGLLIGMALLFPSCEDVIEVDLNAENLDLIGVEANITTESGPTVFLYKTLRVDQDQNYPGISGADITVSDNGVPANAIKLVEDEAIKGFYKIPANSEYIGKIGMEYTLTIQTKGILLSAREKLFPVEIIDSIRVMPSMIGDSIFLGVFAYGWETKGIGNYYKWDIYVNDTLLNKAQNLSFASDEFVDGNYINRLEVFTDFHDPDKPAERKLKLNDVVQVRQTSISEFAYYFYFQMFNQTNSGSLFSVPPANIKSNFTSSDGKPVLGLFVARDISKSNKVLIDQKLEDQLRKR
jgi:hypothetical protein